MWSLVTFKGKTYSDKSPYPPFANALGWLMIAFAIMFIPLFAIVAIVKKKGIFNVCITNNNLLKPENVILLFTTF